MAQWKTHRKRAAHRAKLFLKYWLERKPNDPLFLLASARSGSNFLLGLLNSVPGVSLASEVLHPEMSYGIRPALISKNAVLRHIAHSVNACEGPIGGAKLLLGQMQRHGLTPDDLLARFPRARFILLYRRSMIDQFISLKIAEKTGQWQTTKGHAASAPIRVAAEELRDYCRKTRRDYEALLKDARLAGRTLLLDYETLSADPQGIFEQAVFPFLKLPSSPVSSPFRKRPEKKAEVIENYAEYLRLAKEPWTRQDYPSLLFQEAAVA